MLTSTPEVNGSIEIGEMYGLFAKKVVALQSKERNGLPSIELSNSNQEGTEFNGKFQSLMSLQNLVHYQLQKIGIDMAQPIGRVACINHLEAQKFDIQLINIVESTCDTYDQLLNEMFEKVKIKGY